CLTERSRWNRTLSPNSWLSSASSHPPSGAGWPETTTIATGMSREPPFLVRLRLIDGHIDLRRVLQCARYRAHCDSEILRGRGSGFAAASCSKQCNNQKVEQQPVS